MRLYKCFKTKEERSAWEKDRKAKSERFRVCMRMTSREFEKDMHMDLGEYKYVTVYTTD